MLCVIDISTLNKTYLIWLFDVTPGEYGTRKEGVFISVNSGVDYSIYSSSPGSSIGWYK